MAYTKTEWVNNVTPLNADNLNKIENKLETIDTQITEITSSGDTSHTHTNLTVLNALSDSAGVINYNGQPIQVSGNSSDITVTDSLNNGNIIVNSTELQVYQHPSGHSASMITQDSTHRFVTDNQITNWNSGEGGTGNSVYINVKDYGAVGNGTTDDTLAFNSAITYANSKGGGTVIVPIGTYIIDPDYNNNKSVLMKSNVTLLMQTGSILRAKANSLATYGIIRIKNVENVTVIGGTVYGDRTNHTGTSGEWGHGISISQSTDVTINGVVIKNCWGDGIYLTGDTLPCKNIKIHNCISDNNRRQGMSIVYADGVIVTNSIFRNTNGTPPEAGVDLEPNEGTSVKNCEIIGCFMYNNNGCGFGATVNATENVFLSCYSKGNKQRGVYLGGNANNTRIENCKIVDNQSDGIYMGFTQSNIISQNYIARNSGYGINAINSCSENTIARNNILGNLSGGISLYDANNAIITGNRITGNTGNGIVTQSSGGIDMIAGNIVTGNSGTGINIKTTTSVVIGNCVTGNTGTELSTSSATGSVVASNYVS